MRIYSAAFILTFLLLTSCKNSKEHKWSALPETTDISKMPLTEFVPTLESPTDGNKNVVYAAAFLYAWDGVKQKLNTPLILGDKNSNEFRLVNESTSFKNTLTDEEYSVETMRGFDGVAVKAFFNKTLPFPSKLQKLDRPISFNKTNVSAFGIQSYEERAARFVEILYYKDDDNFVLRLIPKDKEHQIVLAKGIDKVSNLMAAVEKTNALIRIGNKERTLPQAMWKYALNDSDMFSIPIIQFNIETHYNDITGQTFTTNGKLLYVEDAYQQTGFILNENGTVIESEASVTVTDSTVKEPIKILPKKMVFDKPFFIIIKREKSENPYFVMYIRNTELLTKP